MIYLDFRLRFWTIDYRFWEIQFVQKGIFPYLPIFGPLILARISLRVPKIQFGHGLKQELNIAVVVSLQDRKLQLELLFVPTYQQFLALESPLLAILTRKK